MESRYRRMSTLAVRNIDAFNIRVRQTQKRVGPGSPATPEADLAPMPYIVVVVDEFADLMLVAGKEIEAAVQRLAQMARAAGIHLIMATQRPSVDIVTGTIKANFPTRISYKVASKFDSRTIINEQGAEQLLGEGDMLFSNGAGRTLRVHGPFVADEEVERIAAYLRDQGEPRYVDGITDAAAPGRGDRHGRQACSAGGERSLRSCGRHRAQRAQGLHQLPAAAAHHRLQPRRRPDGAHGAGRHRQRAGLRRAAPDPPRARVPRAANSGRRASPGRAAGCAGRSALASPTILSQCWDKRWSFGSNHVGPNGAPRGSFMHARITAQLAVIAVVALAPAWVLAQDAKKPVPPNPVGAGGTWSQTVNKEAAIAGEEFDKKQMELIQKVTGYFNQMTEIKGRVRADERRQQARFAESSTSSSPDASASTTIRPAGS